MTPFFSRELSQALQEAGCVSESGFYYHRREGGGFVIEHFNTPPPVSWELVPAFHPWDLCGPSDQALINRKIICRRKPYIEMHNYPRMDTMLQEKYTPVMNVIVITKKVPYWEYFHHALIDLPSHEEQEAYVWATMRKAT